ncbi:type II toxin-antitoxin system HipA family toxin [Lacisediminimonas sp.]|uniref:type II toxin-antitoxin system HipA family toxin n=1 Tax=Lacisediminimonas sp. TaxID=3060582 RepID=UPI00271C5A02|nr:HipA domain-containing protein [Lacisediminimonas sp.]MDO8300371.1 HipA domain-containing protein [Lacisediminimonas sp.]MDO9217773.1 HipA domain-containing protein [Lacisediminimonas sp.]
MTTSIRYLKMTLHCPSRGRVPVGYLSQYGDVLRVSFDADYIEDPQRPTLSLCYRGSSEQQTREILSAMRDARVVRNDGRWPAYFQNLLPEGHNRERLALERRCNPDDEFELLAAAGHDLMGALEVEPVPLSAGIPEAVRHWHAALGIDVLEPEFVASPVEDAASLPGVITKFSAVLEGRRYVVKRHGAAGSVILKLPTARHPELVANEYMGYQLARAVGLNCACAQIISKDQADLPDQVPFPQILAVQRFDRGQNGVRIHIEEFAQVLGYEPRHKYGKGLQEDYSAMLRIIDQLSVDPANDVQEFINRFVIFALMGNTDAHLKNWALRYENGVDPALSPLYDPVCVTAFFEDAPRADYGINRAIDAKLQEFSWDDLEDLLKRARIQRRSRLIQVAKGVIKQARADWPALLQDAPDNMRRSIMGRLAGGIQLAR